MNDSLYNFDKSIPEDILIMSEHNETDFKTFLATMTQMGAHLLKKVDEMQHSISDIKETMAGLITAQANSVTGTTCERSRAECAKAQSERWESHMKEHSRIDVNFGKIFLVAAAGGVVGSGVAGAIISFAFLVLTKKIGL